MKKNNLYLIYININSKNSNNEYEYEFFFSETPEIVWGEEWDVNCPSSCTNTLPYPYTYSHVEILKTEIPMFCIQQNSCFPILFAKRGLVCLGAEDISNYENYPEPMRLVFQFEEKYDSVVEKLRIRYNFFESNNDLNIENKEENNIF